MKTNREELKRLALSATPGPWFIQYGDDDNHMCMTAIGTENMRTRNDGQFSQKECEKLVAVTLHQLYPWVDPECITDDANSEYIAAANPTVVLSLLADLERAEAELKTMRGQEPIGYLYDWVHSSSTGKGDTTYTGFTTDKDHAFKERHDNAKAIYAAPVAQPDEITTYIVKVTRWAAGKIEAERKRGAGYFHAEVDALVALRPYTTHWLKQHGLGGDIPSAPELPAAPEAP